MWSTVYQTMTKTAHSEMNDTFFSLELQISPKNLEQLFFRVVVMRVTSWDLHYKFIAVWKCFCVTLRILEAWCKSAYWRSHFAVLFFILVWVFLHIFEFMKALLILLLWSLTAKEHSFWSLAMSRNNTFFLCFVSYSSFQHVRCSASLFVHYWPIIYWNEIPAAYCS